ncbi:hypothetical protein [Natronococcus jeotgali]|uniref:Uncharacterized protein n=1 Tax=Natronococcus jeotgali DSM 18795 TaxID=1227498 RepID=L9WV29_9EURY|nr:hypothetical protein [Natronococcus jeotgali]ELY53021.1 hypothetical protein C492_18209 [Natronococcus jeotgali DSM 18795]
MALAPDAVEILADEYPDEQPLAAVEDEHRELLPATLRKGAYGRRDVEWIVQWYFRRLLGRYPDAERRAAEERFGDNEYEALETAIEGALAAETTRAKLEALTELTGVDVPIGTAFLQFLEPERYLAMSAREWGVFREQGELEEPYPDEPNVEDYERYLERCRELERRCDRDLWDCYRALWLLGHRSEGGR